MGDWNDARFGVEGLSCVFDASTATEVAGEVLRRFAADADMFRGIHCKNVECRLDCAVSPRRASYLRIPLKSMGGGSSSERRDFAAQSHAKASLLGAELTPVGAKRDAALSAPDEPSSWVSPPTTSMMSKGREYGNTCDITRPAQRRTVTVLASDDCNVRLLRAINKKGIAMLFLLLGGVTN